LEALLKRWRMSAFGQSGNLMLGLSLTGFEPYRFLT